MFLAVSKKRLLSGISVGAFGFLIVSLGNWWFYISIEIYPLDDNCVKKSSIWQANNVVLVAGLIPVNSAIRKNSRRAKWTIKLIAIANHQLPRETIKKPKAPTKSPLNNLFFETAKDIKSGKKI